MNSKLVNIKYKDKITGNIIDIDLTSKASSVIHSDGQSTQVKIDEAYQKLSNIDLAAIDENFEQVELMMHTISNTDFISMSKVFIESITTESDVTMI